MRSQSLWRNFDYVLLAAVGLLIVIGLFMIRSATFDAIDDELRTRVSDQVLYAVIGLGVMVFLASVDYRTLGGLSLWLYLTMVVLLVLVLALGVVGDAGAQRWINFGIRIQPSEIGKIFIIITLGTYLSKR
ncbi:rod shape-determining protein RodA, partial [Anaerolineae bacterium CFX4]|nr:rod shape-determining protein RodA [Anaerolineae bacterium CFX4]